MFRSYFTINRDQEFENMIFFIYFCLETKSCKKTMKQVDDLSGNKVAVCPVLRIGHVDEPTLTFYPACLSGEPFSIAPELKVDGNAPPTILIQTQDDKSHIDSSIFYYYALKQANVTAALHLYPSGGHGYGLRNTGHTVNEWPFRVLSWLRDIGMVE